MTVSTSALEKVRKAFVESARIEIEREMYSLDAASNRTLDLIAAIDLQIWIENDEPSYRSACAYGRLVAHRIIKGDFNARRALAGGAENFAAVGSRRYRRQNGGTADIFPRDVRRVAAGLFLIAYLTEWALGNY